MLRALAVVLVLTPAFAYADEAEPFRIAKAVEAPGWLAFGLEHRSRFEHTENTFFAGPDADPTAFGLRTLLSARATSEPASLVLELEDSRTYASDDTRLNTTHVDPLELLQAHVALQPKDLFVAGDRAEIKLGRMTVDLGSRRLVARNDFRNTINAFTGIDTRWVAPSKHAVRAFAVLPVVRRPRVDGELRDHEVDLDTENVHALLWAVSYESREVRGTVAEVFAIGLHERDSAEHPSLDRQLLTPGLRFVKKPAAGTLDFQLEGAFQLGTARASTMSTTDLDHRAYTLHAELGARPRVAWSPRLSALYDHASGDRDPDDATNQRFDPLFGARRFDFGPTGTYGSFARSNVISPGARLEVVPHARFEAMATYRLYWLASRSDTWIPAGIREPDAPSSFVGHQVEARGRWHVIPKNLSFEAGAARLVRGAFARVAREAPATFVYFQLTATI